MPALALWGWQAELWIWGLLLGMLLEARRLSSFRLLEEWCRRVVPESHPARNAIFEGLYLHQQLRFDPTGLPASDRDRLAVVAAALNP